MSHDGECALGLPRRRAFILSMVPGWEITQRQQMLLAAALNAFGPDLRGQGWSSGLIRGNRMQIETFPRP